MIKNQDKYEPVRCVVLANSGQGKTTYISKFISDRIGKQWKPKHIIIISKTHKADPSIEPLIAECIKKYPKFKESNCFDDVTAGVAFIQELYKGQKFIKEDLSKPIHQWCVLLDDMISEGILYDKQFVMLSSLCRHYGISLFTLLQESKALSPKILGQSNLLIVGRLSNQDRLEDLLSQFNEGLASSKKDRKEKVMQLFTIAMSKADRGFLIIKPHVFNVKDRFLDLNMIPLLNSSDLV